MLVFIITALYILVSCAYYCLVWPILLLPAVSALGAPKSTLSTKVYIFSILWLFSVTFIPIGIGVGIIIWII